MAQWLSDLEENLQEMARITGWPIEKIRGIYNVFGIGFGMASQDENDPQSDTH